MRAPWLRGEHDTSFEPFSYRGNLDIRGKTKSYDGVTAEKDMEGGRLQCRTRNHTAG
jgi:hypothetical protein